VARKAGGASGTVKITYVHRVAREVLTEQLYPPTCPQVYPVKAMLNADALTSPGCPLWKDGQEGIELYIGKPLLPS
jgi:hypothetical protein